MSITVRVENIVGDNEEGRIVAIFPGGLEEGRVDRVVPDDKRPCSGTEQRNDLVVIFVCLKMKTVKIPRVSLNPLQADLLNGDASEAMATSTLVVVVKRLHLGLNLEVHFIGHL